MFKHTPALLSVLLLFTALANAQDATKPSAALNSSTCTGTYPSYFQDPAFTATGMWDNQVIINRPTADWRGPVFAISDAYSTAVPESELDYPWLKFNPFDPNLSPSEKLRQADGYLWAVMAYIQEGNINSGKVATDWSLCNNTGRKWFHIPFQTYEPLSGREFVHGLTREAPVTMEIKTDSGSHQLKTTMWATTFYNPAAAQSLSKIWTDAGTPKIPTQNFHFNEGSVIGKPLFTTATSNAYPYLTNMPVWRANINAPEFCVCKPSSGSQCTFTEQTEQCPRTVGNVSLLQFDISVRDKRSPIGWAYGTFVADGQRKAKEPNPWNRISPLGLMWGNDKPPVGTLAVNYPVNPRQNGFKEEVIFWNVADMMNLQTGGGHLGCNGRLNGPADHAQSSCLSCHQTASVPDANNSSPALLYQFGNFGTNNQQCSTEPKALNLKIDQVYFKNVFCSTPIVGPTNVLPAPDYTSGRRKWISLDFSLQLSISLTQWQEWQLAQKSPGMSPVLKGVLPTQSFPFEQGQKSAF